jgi:hypothetical protein
MSIIAKSFKKRKMRNLASSNPHFWTNLRTLWSRQKLKRKLKNKGSCWRRNSNNRFKILSGILNWENRKFYSTISKRSSGKNKNGNRKKSLRKNDWDKKLRNLLINNWPRSKLNWNKRNSPSWGNFSKKWILKGNSTNKIMTWSWQPRKSKFKSNLKFWGLKLSNKSRKDTIWKFQNIVNSKKPPYTVKKEILRNYKTKKGNLTLNFQLKSTGLRRTSIGNWNKKNGNFRISSKGNWQSWNQ